MGFPKEYEQTVPKYSAVKINGKKLYEYARENIDIELPKRMVNISSFLLRVMLSGIHIWAKGQRAIIGGLLSFIPLQYPPQ